MRRPSKPGKPVHPLLLDRFRRTMHALTTHMPVDYGAAPLGTIRFFSVSPGTCGPWYMNTIASHDRSLCEWLALINEWTKGVLPEKYDSPLASHNPFTTRRAAAEFLTELLAKELRLRWFARKFVMRLRERVYARRTVGADCDLHTTLPVPAHAMVSVRDRDSRSLYVFHVKTITSMFQNSLKYSNFGIACPQVPKNPYTNKAWSPTQLMEITSQILAHTHLSQRRVHPQRILEFCKCDHDISKYYLQYSEQLQLEGAQSFFKEIHNEELNQIREDLLDDFYDSLGHDICCGWRTVRAFVLERLLSEGLNNAWEKLLCGLWIYTNFQKCVGFESYDRMLEEFSNLHTQSYEWWCAQPKHLLRRPVSDDLDSTDSE
jgi:hypothetical protein